jgi:ATP-dependent helicase/nuclease subunit B
VKNDGNLSKRSKVASLKDFKDLSQYVRKLYQKTGNEIIDGQVAIEPYKLKDKTPCTFCSFKSVCHFDVAVESNRYRMLTPQSNDNILEMIRKELSSESEQYRDTVKA